MLRTNLPRAVRVLRRRRGWRQTDLAKRASVSGPTISRIERGNFEAMPLGALQRIASALEASVDLTIRWEGAQLDRLIDAAHASLEQETATMLSASGWLVAPEVSFNHFGDRGRVDLLAFHPVARLVLVVEVKSALGDLQDALGRLDVKARLGRSLAESTGWTGAYGIVPAFVFADTRTNRRVITNHEALFARFTVRGRSALAWTRRPSAPAPSGLLWFASVPDLHGVNVMRGKRVRTVRSGQ